jgi:chromosome segregation ATPase
MEVEEVLQRTSAEPSRISRQAESIEAAAVNMKSEIKNLEKDLVHIAEDITKFVAKKAHMEELKLSLNDKLAANKEAIETREVELGAVISELEREKARGNDLITRKIEYNLKKKESESLLRRSLDELNTISKSYEGLKRQLKKKRTIADESKQAIPALESNILNGNANINIYRDEQKALKSEYKTLKHEVDAEIVKLLSQENLESSKKAVSII